MVDRKSDTRNLQKGGTLPVSKFTDVEGGASNIADTIAGTSRSGEYIMRTNSLQRIQVRKDRVS